MRSSRFASKFSPFPPKKETAGNKLVSLLGKRKRLFSSINDDEVNSLNVSNLRKVIKLAQNQNIHSGIIGTTKLAILNTLSLIINREKKNITQLYISDHL